MTPDRDEERPDRSFLRHAVEELEEDYQQEQEEIARRNRRKTLLVGLLLAFVLGALLLGYLLPA